MALRVGLLTCAHLHVWAYVASLKDHPAAELVGIWDHDRPRAEAFSTRAGVPIFESREALLEAVDAVGIVSENTMHAELGIEACERGRHVLCEKPLVVDEDEGRRLLQAAQDADVRLMTAFPCRFSPAYQRLKERVRAREIGVVRGICATNRGRCPKGWFVQENLSGGGAMIDHVVHVADLLIDLLGEEPTEVQAQIGSNMYSESWDDTAMLTLSFPSGVFATLDSSWSRPSSYKTWGDVTMNVVGDGGVIELDMFGPAADHFHEGAPSHSVAPYGSNLDRLMIDEFVAACLEGRPALTDGEAGFKAARVAIAGYRSARESPPVAVSN